MLILGNVGVRKPYPKKDAVVEKHYPEGVAGKFFQIPLLR
jgi:hypothetical protein